RSALEALHGQLFGWALSRCNYDQAAAEDLMQQAYVELLTGNARFDKRSSLKTFVFSVIQNLARSRFRRLASRLRLVQQYGPSQVEVTGDAGEGVQDHGVWAAVKDLPPRQRDIIELVFCREMTIAEASKVMGVTTGTGRVHYDRAKKALRTKLEERNDQR
ncbi:MAG: RNA polymerase sigma factor, partial [Woeseiaceae bacterium]